MNSQQNISREKSTIPVIYYPLRQGGQGEGDENGAVVEWKGEGRKVEEKRRSQDEDNTILHYSLQFLS